MLRQLTMLQYISLHLAENKISDTGATWLATLQQAPVLHTLRLNLMCNRVTDDGARVLAGLTASPMLHTCQLTLWYNKLGSSGIGAINAMKAASSLRCCDVEGPRVGLWAGAKVAMVFGAGFALMMLPSRLFRLLLACGIWLTMYHHVTGMVPREGIAYLYDYCAFHVLDGMHHSVGPNPPLVLARGVLVAVVLWDSFSEPDCFLIMNNLSVVFGLCGAAIFLALQIELLIGRGREAVHMGNFFGDCLWLLAKFLRAKELIFSLRISIWLPSALLLMCACHDEIMSRHLHESSRASFRPRIEAAR